MKHPPAVATVVWFSPFGTNLRRCSAICSFFNESDVYPFCRLNAARMRRDWDMEPILSKCPGPGEYPLVALKK